MIYSNSVRGSINISNYEKTDEEEVIYWLPQSMSMVMVLL